MNETQEETLRKSADDLQARIDDLNSQKDAAQQAVENIEARLPELQAELQSLKEGLSAPTVIDGGETA